MSSNVITVNINRNSLSNTIDSALNSINSGYITSRLGIVKLTLMTLSLICLILVLVEAHTTLCVISRESESTCYKIYSGDLFLLLVNFCHLYVVAVMLVVCVISESSATYLPRASFDYVFHAMAFGLFVIAGMWVFIDATSDGRSGTIIMASLFALLCGSIHLLHALHSYWKSIAP